MDDARMAPVRSIEPTGGSWVGVVIFAVGCVAVVGGVALLLVGVVNSVAGATPVVRLLAAGPVVAGLWVTLGGLLLMGFGRLVSVVEEIAEILRRIG